MQRAQNFYPRYRPPFRGSSLFYPRGRGYWNKNPNRNDWNQNNWSQNPNRGRSFSQGRHFPARRRFSGFRPNRWSSFGRPVCNQCRITRHSTNSCNQYANFKQQTYRNYQGPDTGYFQPIVPSENYGYFQPIQSQAPPPEYHPTVSRRQGKKRRK